MAALIRIDFAKEFSSLTELINRKAPMRTSMRYQRKSVLKKYLVSVGFLAIAIPVPLWSAVPVLNSDPSAAHVIYLDFNHHHEPKSAYTCPPPLNGIPEGWPIDLDVSDISNDIDATSVTKIWEAVAEDFAPFFVNVTTDPAQEPSGNFDTGAAIRIAIGKSSLDDALGHSPSNCDPDTLANPPYLNPRIANVAIVGLDPQQQFNEREIAKRISHEAGHLYGLNHHLAAADPIDDWIMAPQRSSTRFIWRKGKNEFNALQDDVEQLSRLLGRRPDGGEPKRLRTTTSIPVLHRLYAHGTLETPNDIDEFLFTVSGAGHVTFEILGGVWADPAIQDPEHGHEANFRPSFQLRSQNGRVVLACPDATLLTLTATTDQIITVLPPIGGSKTVFPCPSTPQPLQVGKTYRVLVFRHSNNRLDGHLGRYTVLASGPVRAVSRPPTVGP